MDPEQVVVEFSNGTTSVFTVEQLLSLRPKTIATEQQRSMSDEKFDVRPDSL